MRLKSYIYFNKEDKKLEFVDKPVKFAGIKVGKIIETKLDTSTEKMEITIQINKKSIDIIRNLVKG